MINKNLCNKGIIDLSYSCDQYIARTFVNEIYFENDFKKTKRNINTFYSNIKQIKCIFNQTIVLTSRVGVCAFDSRNYVQIDKECNESQQTLSKLNYFNDKKVVMISCRAYHSLVLKESGLVYSWGQNSEGQSGQGNTFNLKVPKCIKMA
jgi:alpha-tubulin suppressor-like RCC1 family protein